MRLFIGVDLPAEIKQALLDFQSELRLLGVNGSFKSQDNFHITLEFLGELNEVNISAITETLSRIARNYRPFDLNIEGIGAFPSFKRPHTLWTGVNGSLTELKSLRDDLHRELKIKGFQLEDRHFKPHITIASRPKLDMFKISDAQIKRLGEFVVKDVVLFESRAIRGKRVYVDLFRAALLHKSLLET